MSSRIGKTFAMEITTMTFLIGFAALSITFSALVVSACALSSKISRVHEWEEPYEATQKINLQPATQSTH